MRFLEIEGWNVKLAEDQPEYETIKVRSGMIYTQQGSLLVPVPSLCAKIEPDADELKKLNAGGYLYLTILGKAWPPCSISTIDPALEHGIPDGTA